MGIWVFDDLLPESFLGDIDDIMGSGSFRLPSRASDNCQSVGGSSGDLMQMPIPEITEAPASHCFGEEVAITDPEKVQLMMNVLKNISNSPDVNGCPYIVVRENHGDVQAPHMDYASLININNEMSLNKLTSNFKSLDTLDQIDMTKQSHVTPHDVVPTISFVIYFNDVGGLVFPNADQSIESKRGRIVMFENYNDKHRPAHDTSSAHYGVYHSHEPKRYATMGILADETLVERHDFNGGEVLYCTTGHRER